MEEYERDRQTDRQTDRSQMNHKRELKHFMSLRCKPEFQQFLPNSLPLINVLPIIYKTSLHANARLVGYCLL